LAGILEERRKKEKRRKKNHWSPTVAPPSTRVRPLGRAQCDASNNIVEAIVWSLNDSLYTASSP